MSQAEADIRTAVAAYASVFTGTKPKITLSVYGDGEIQLFLHAPDASHFTHAQGSGKTLEDAAVALKVHLARRLEEIRAQDEKQLAESVAYRTKFHERIVTAIAAVKPEPTTPA